MKRTLLWLRNLKPERVMFFGGLAAIGGGIGAHDPGAGFAVVGALALLSLKPLRGWF